MSDVEIKAVFDIMDENQDGKVSYGEFTNLLAKCSLTSKLDDRSHWAFHIFEHLRRRLRDQN